MAKQKKTKKNITGKTEAFRELTFRAA